MQAFTSQSSHWVATYPRPLGTFYHPLCERGTMKALASQPSRWSITCPKPLAASHHPLSGRGAMKAFTSQSLDWAITCPRSIGAFHLQQGQRLSARREQSTREVVLFLQSNDRESVRVDRHIATSPLELATAVDGVFG